MKKAGTIIGAIALTFVIGGALILGNAAFAAKTAAAIIGSPAAISAANLETVSNVKTDREITGNVLDSGGENKAVVMKTLPNGSTVLVEYSYGADGAEATVTYSADGTVRKYAGDAAEAAIERFGGPKRDRPNRYVEGQPSESDITKKFAASTAVTAIADKYALTTETLDRFNVTTTFYSAYEDISGAVWFVRLYPVNVDDFSEIGAYSAILSAATGDPLQILSATDGKG
ncbi:MAG: hypothetical protein LBS62_01865 [Clostridiales bacterium]|nr:hypothetical protein [Clostridiales bacterium]